jgi:glutathione S-transferase
LFRPNTPDDYKPIVKESLANRFNFIDKHLAGRHYLMGDQFTVADAYLFTVMRWTSVQHIDLARWSNIAAYMGRVAARPKVTEALQAEGLLK